MKIMSISEILLAAYLLGLCTACASSTSVHVEKSDGTVCDIERQTRIGSDSSDEK